MVEAFGVDLGGRTGHVTLTDDVLYNGGLNETFVMLLVRDRS